MPVDDSSLLDITNASGFPLQIAVENVVYETQKQHGWLVRHREHAWTLSGQSGFIDLVLENEHGTSCLVVECKRVREGAWIFLHAQGSVAPRRHAKIWVNWYSGGRTRVFGWHDLASSPESPEAGFCTLRGQDASGQRSLLERVGSELVLSTEAFAHERRDFRPADVPADLQRFASVIVTTAQLKVARFKPEVISLENGTIPEGEVEFLDVPVVRFRKQLAARELRLGPDDYKSRNTTLARDNTVFIVHASALPDFLEGYEQDDGPLRALTSGGA